MSSNMHLFWKSILNFYQVYYNRSFPVLFGTKDDKRQPILCGSVNSCCQRLVNLLVHSHVSLNIIVNEVTKKNITLIIWILMKEKKKKIYWAKQKKKFDNIYILNKVNHILVLFFFSFKFFFNRIRHGSTRSHIP